MTILKGKPIVAGKASGPALVTTMPMNFTASFTKPKNLVRRWLAVVQDRHHELYKQSVRGKVLVYPATIGSTYTGMVLLELMYQGCAPAAIIVSRADSLMVSGSILANAWYDKGVPIIEYEADDIFDIITNGQRVEVDGSSGRITIG